MFLQKRYDCKIRVWVRPTILKHNSSLVFGFWLQNVQQPEVSGRVAKTAFNLSRRLSLKKPEDAKYIFFSSRHKVLTGLPILHATCPEEHFGKKLLKIISVFFSEIFVRFYRDVPFNVSKASLWAKNCFQKQLEFTPFSDSRQNVSTRLPRLLLMERNLGNLGLLGNLGHT